MKRNNRIARRDFLKQTIAAGIGSIMIVPRNVIGGEGYVPPSETLGGALIGCGGRGPGTFGEMQKGLNVVQLARCDVRWKGKADNKTTYTDFRY
ncbi:MAG: gfo/Idh/MocA family oxidoreductase, partial [Limisphaerales bacterium]